MGYGSETAQDADVSFAFGLALEAARDLHTLSGRVGTAQGSRATAAGRARPDWIGPKRDTFDLKAASEDESATEVSEGLVTLADSFALQWSRARGEQDRINFARYVDHEINDDSWGEDAVEWVAGEDDYGSPPPDPDVPSAPGYEPTRAPMHTDYGP